MTPGGNVIGKGKCRQCLQPVWLKKNVNGRAYYYCDGTGPGAASMCAHHEKFGPIESAKVIAQTTPSKTAASAQQIDKVEHEDPNVRSGTADRPDAAAAAAAGAKPSRRGGLIARAS